MTAATTHMITNTHSHTHSRPTSSESLFCSYGGYYFDCDTTPQRSLPLRQLLEKYKNKSAFVFEESVLSSSDAAAAAAHAIRRGGGEMRQRVANYAMVIMIFVEQH